MIFLAVGTQKFQFNRLLKEMDELVAKGKIEEDVFAQIGNCDYIPRGYQYETFISKQKFDEQIHQCDLLITHSGVATIMAGLKIGKPVIVVPRLSKYYEHIDDHQAEIAEVFSDMKYVVYCNENMKLHDAIRIAKEKKMKPYISKNKVIIKEIKSFLQNI